MRARRGRRGMLTHLVDRRRNVRRVEQQQVDAAGQACLQCADQVSEHHLRERQKGSNKGSKLRRRASATTPCCANVARVAAAARGLISVAKHAALPCAEDASLRDRAGGRQRKGLPEAAAPQRSPHSRCRSQPPHKPGVGPAVSRVRCRRRGHAHAEPHGLQQRQVSHQRVHQRKRVLRTQITPYLSCADARASHPPGGAPLQARKRRRQST